MLLRNDKEGIILLDEVVVNYYRTRERSCIGFLHSENVEWNELYSHFLIDRKHVIRLSLVKDREIFLTAIELGIGPHYFTPSDFWSYENSQRFRISANDESIVINLKLLDEFFATQTYPK